MQFPGDDIYDNDFLPKLIRVREHHAYTGVALGFRSPGSIERVDTGRKYENILEKKRLEMDLEAQAQFGLLEEDRETKIGRDVNDVEGEHTSSGDYTRNIKEEGKWLSLHISGDKNSEDLDREYCDEREISTLKKDSEDLNVDVNMVDGDDRGNADNTKNELHLDQRKDIVEIIPQEDEDDDLFG